MRKGQAATEYLMTYGWALLAIAIVGALLYYQVFANRACGPGGATGFQMQNAVVPTGTFSLVANDDGTVSFQIEVENRMVDKAVNITKLKLGDVEVTTITGGTNLEPGDRAVISGTTPSPVSGAKSGKCYNLQVVIYYRPEGNFTQDIANPGTLSGRYV